MQSKLDEIANVLCDSADKFDNLGVLSGISGLALFMFYYSRLSGGLRYAEVGEQALEKSVDMINNGFRVHTFYSGISGMAWTFEHLERHGFLEQGISSFLEDLEPYLLSCMERDFGMENYDFLHGGLGIGYYFISSQKKNHKAITLLLDCLEGTAEKISKDCWKWISVLDRETKMKGYNISLSHGMSSIVASMVKLIKMHPEFSERAKSILSNTVSYIMQQQLTQPAGSYFPSHSLENEDIFAARNSRLAWCYGDLGVTQALLQAADVLQDSNLAYAAEKILLYNCERKDLTKSGVLDAGVCHGAAGIAHIFQKIYQKNRNITFQETANYWFEKTLEMARFDNGVAGFKQWNRPDSNWIDNYSLLEGVIGIACCLMSCLNIEHLGWSECVLLD